MIDTTLSSFERDVIEASMEVPVILDFWAPWCGPCRMLGPLLEKLEREYGGRFKLVNVNSDTNPELVASFNLKSIPYAVAFVDGNAVAQFTGAQPEPFVRAFLISTAERHSTYARVKERMQAAETAAGLPPIDMLARRIHLNHNDLEARLELAELLISRRDHAPAMIQLLEIVKRDRSFRDDIGRLKMLCVLEMAADDADLVTEYRNRLARLLF